MKRPATPAEHTRLRVLHVVDSDVFGGAEQAVLNLLAATDQQRWELFVAHHPSPGIERFVRDAQDVGAKVCSVPAMPLGPAGWRTIPSFVSFLRRLRPDIVHVHLTWPLACQIPILATVLAHVPAVVATSQLFVEVPLSRRESIQQRVLTKAVDRYIAVSGDLRSRLVQTYGWPGDRIDVIHNSVDVLRFTTGTDGRLRRDLAVPSDRALALIPARLTAQKGHRHLFAAARQLLDVHFVIAGDGPDRAILESLASELDVADRVSFLGEREDVAELLAGSDLVVLPSIDEGLPLALLEAMAAGKPVVATRVGGVPELVIDGQNGLLVESANEQALASAIRRLVDDPVAARLMGTSARQIVVERFSNETMGRKVMQVYDSALAR